MAVSEEIYDYIDSDSISEYCRSSGHQFSLLECAGIVYWSTGFDLHQKQKTYQKLLRLCNSECEWGDMCKADIESLQRHLKRLIREADTAYLFMQQKPKPGELFGFSKSKRYEYNNEVFSSAQNALSYMLKYKDTNLWNEICVIRPDAPEHPAQSLCFSPDGILYEADGFTPSGFGKKDNSWPEDAYIGYPLPFENGDLIVFMQDDGKESFGVFSKPSPDKARTDFERWKSFGSTAQLGRYYRAVRLDWDAQPHGGRYEILLDSICVYNTPKVRLTDSLIWNDKIENAGFLQSLSALMKRMPCDVPSIYGFMQDYLSFWNCRSATGPASLVYGHDEHL